MSDWIVNIVKDLSMESQPLSLPEKVIVAAVLERAFWDLDYLKQPLHAVRSAVQWFTYPGTGRISFVDVRSILPLTPSRMKIIERRLQEAVDFLNALESGEVAPDKASRKLYASSKDHAIADGKAKRMRYTVSRG